MYVPLNMPLCYKLLEKKTAPRCSASEFPHCDTSVGKIMVDPLNFEAYSQSLCLSPPGLRALHPWQEVNPA